DLKRKILGNNAHIVVDVNRPGGFGAWQDKLEVTRKALTTAGGARCEACRGEVPPPEDGCSSVCGAATPVVGGEAMASSASNTAGALVRGIDPDTIGTVINLKENIEVGSFEYFIDPEKLLDLGADEIVGRGPGGEPYFHGPDFRNAPDVDPSVKE